MSRSPATASRVPTPEQPAGDAPARTAATRISEIDALRGFALLGICMVNAPVLAGASDLGTQPGAPSPTTSRPGS